MKELFVEKLRMGGIMLNVSSGQAIAGFSASRKVRAPQSRVLGASPVSASLRKVQQKIYRAPKGRKGEMAGQGPTGIRATGWPCKPHPEQGQIGGGQGLLVRLLG